MYYFTKKGIERRIYKSMNIIGEKEDKAREYLKEIIPEFSPLMLFFLTKIMVSQYRNIFSNINVIEEEDGTLKQIKELGKDNVIIWIPKHESNLDNLVYRYVIHKGGCKAPLTRAGKNLFMGISRDLLSLLNVYCVDRGLLDPLSKERYNPLYRKVKQEFEKEMVRQGKDFLIYIQDGRSYSGDIYERYNPSLISNFVKLQKESLGVQSYIVLLSSSYTVIPEDKELIEANKNKKRLPPTSLIGDFERFKREFKDDWPIYVYAHKPRLLDDLLNDVGPRISAYRTIGKRIINSIGEKTIILSTTLQLRACYSLFVNKKSINHSSLYDETLSLWEKLKSKDLLMEEKINDSFLKEVFQEALDFNIKRDRLTSSLENSGNGLLEFYANTISHLT
jgi:hypothetical protein